MLHHLPYPPSHFELKKIIRILKIYQMPGREKKKNLQNLATLFLKAMERARLLRKYGSFHAH